MNDIKNVFNSFQTDDDFLSYENIKDGLINDTFLIHCKKNKYILQKINNEVFIDAKSLIDNFFHITEHVNSKNIFSKKINLIKNKNDSYAFIDNSKNYWRLLNYIESKTYTKNNFLNYKDEFVKVVKETSIAYANFNYALVDLNPDLIIDTISNFHDGELKYKGFIKSKEYNYQNRKNKSLNEINLVEKNKDILFYFKNLVKNKVVPSRIVHNDTKLSNILFDKKDSKALCVIDLDTVMKGSILYDFGDMCRSLANTTGEEELNFANVNFNLDLYKIILDNYLSVAKKFITNTELDNLNNSVKFMSLMLGTRFLSDYLSADTYFKTNYKEQNLDRAKVQFKLFESIVKNEKNMNIIFNEIKCKHM